MASMTVSGLGSGLDVAGIVSQLMNAERMQGNPLTRGQNQAKSLVSTLTTLNTQMKSLGEAAAAFSPASVLDVPAFSAVKGTSSDPSIATVTAGSSAGVGNLSFTVSSVAQAGSTVSAAVFGGDTVISQSDFTLDITVGGKTTTVTVAGGATLSDVAQSINQQAANDVKASLVKVGDDSYRLQLTSAATGAGTDVSVSGPLGSFNELTAGRDTVLKIGGNSAGAYEVRSATRDVKDVLPGVTITPLKVSDTTVSVDFSTDIDAIADKAEALVKAANTALSTITDNSKWDDTAKTGGPLLGEATTRDIAYRVRDAFGGDAGYLPQMAGIELTKTGTITFDREKFKAAYAENAEAVTRNVTGLAARLTEISKATTNSADGTLTTRIQGGEATVKDYADRMARFQERMASREALYKQQYTALDTMLSGMKSRSDWLSGQLASLYNS